MLEVERQRRKQIWDTLIAEGGPKNVPTQLLHHLGIYEGNQGIWVNKARTEQLTDDGHGVTVGVLHTGEHYPDDLNEYGIIYHYPSTKRPPSRDRGEIEATKAAHWLSLPIFVITHSPHNPGLRDVYLGWIEEWNDDDQVFRITFTEEKPKEILAQPEDEAPFVPKEEASTQITLTKARPGQQRFSFLVLQRYGEKCAICDIDIPELLDAAHIIPKKHNGTDDPRNGIVLCTLHHRALDAGLFCIDPKTLKILFKDDSPKADRLRITRSNIKHLRAIPHVDALEWLKGNWSK